MAVTTKSHEKVISFVKEALHSEKIFMIMGPDGAAGSFSTEYFDEENDNFPLIPFWTEGSQEEAEACVEENGEDFQIIYIPLKEFLGSWLPGMQEDEVIVGINWNADMTGPEIEPAELFEFFDQHMDDFTRQSLEIDSSAA